MELIKNLKKIWTYIKDQKYNIIKYILANIGGIIINIVIPIFSANVIVNLTNNKFKQLILTTFVIMLIEWARNIVIATQRYYDNIIYREASTAVQNELGKEILKLNNDTLNKNGTGLFINRLTNDTSKIAYIFLDLNTELANIIKCIGIIVAIAAINYKVLIFILIKLTVNYLIERKRVKIYNESDKKYRKEREKISSFISELVRGAKDIRMLNAENSFVNTLDRKIRAAALKEYDMTKTNTIYSFIRGMIEDLFDFLWYILLIYLIINDNLSIPFALVLNTYKNGLSGFMNIISWFLEKSKDFNLSCNRIFEIIDGKEFTKETFGNEKINKINGNFEFKNVSFAYDEKEVLKNINFKVKKNETVAFVGKSGAGKSTIFNLLCKMNDNYKGLITIDDIDIKKLDKDSIRGNITIVSQNPYIFNLSIKDNLKLVKENITDKEIKEACKMACLDDFIESGNNYETQPLKMIQLLVRAE